MKPIFLGNPSVTGGKPQRIQARREYQELPCLGARSRRGGIGIKALVSSGTGLGPRPPAADLGVSGLSPNLCSSRPMPPARTARTPRPTTKPAPPVTEGVHLLSNPSVMGGAERIFSRRRRVGKKAVWERLPIEKGGRIKKGRPFGRPWFSGDAFYDSDFACRTVGVMKIRSSRLTFSVSSALKSHPRTGIFMNQGMPVVVSWFSDS